MFSHNRFLLLQDEYIHIINMRKNFVKGKIKIGDIKIIIR